MVMLQPLSPAEREEMKHMRSKIQERIATATNPRVREGLLLLLPLADLLERAAVDLERADAALRIIQYERS